MNKILCALCLATLAQGGLALANPAGAPEGRGDAGAAAARRRPAPRIIADSQDPLVEARHQLQRKLELRARELEMASSPRGIEQIRQAMLRFQPIRNGYPIPGTESPDSVLFPDVHSAACWSFALTGRYLASSDPLGAPEFYQQLLVFDYDSMRPTGLDTGFLLDLATRFPTARSAIEALERDFEPALQGDAQAQQDFALHAMQTILVAHGFEIDDSAHPEYAVHMRHSQGVWWGWDHWAISLALPIKARSSTVYVQDVVQTVPGHPIRHGCSEVWDEHLPEVVVGVKRLLPEQYLVLYQLVAREPGSK